MQKYATEGSPREGLCVGDRLPQGFITGRLEWRSQGEQTGAISEP